MTETTNNTLLNLSTITEPFDLATALVYMKENGEFIRCKSETQDFYMYRDVQKRPAVVNGRRQFVDVDSVFAYNQWGGISTSINIADLFKKDFYVMKFDENGNPDWSQPSVGVQPMTIEQAEQIAQSQVAWAILFILLFGFVIHYLIKTSDKREAKLMDFHEQSKEESNKREDRLMNHLEKTTAEMGAMAREIGGLKGEVSLMSGRIEKIEKGE